MNVSKIIHELIEARAMLAHQHSGDRATPWDQLPPDKLDLFISHGRRSVEPMLRRPTYELEWKNP